VLHSAFSHVDRVLILLEGGWVFLLPEDLPSTRLRKDYFVGIAAAVNEGTAAGNTGEE